MIVAKACVYLNLKLQICRSQIHFLTTFKMSDTEEEEHLIYLEFNGTLDAELFRRQPIDFKMIGADSDQPILQIGDQIYAGEYRDTVGTALFFEKDPAPPGNDPVFTKVPEIPLQYVCKTRKSLVMSRVFTTPKVADAERMEVDNDSPASELGEMLNDPLSGSELSVSEASAASDEESVKAKKAGKNENEKMDTTPEAAAKEAPSEPVAGPSWAPDIPSATDSWPSGVGVGDGATVEGKALSSKLAADNISKLIAEQMNIASDINLRNIGTDSDELSD